jgi:hypothetical protein
MGKKLLRFIFASLLLFIPSCTTVQSSDFIKAMGGNILGSGTTAPLTENRIIAGLKEALKIGTDKAITTLSSEGSFFNNPKIKIPLPDPLKKIEDNARKIGLGFYFDSFDKSMNSAAEQATPLAKKIILNALQEMTISDAKKILYGRDNEATLYFKEKSFDQLMNIFKPAVHSAMSKTGVTKKYQDIETKVKNMPFIEAIPLNFDLDSYVSKNALNGIFYMVEQEEIKIRKNPAARVTELLKDVFGRK